MVQPRIPDRLYMTGYRSPPCGDGPNQHTERTPIFRLKYVATRGAQNGARLGYRAVLHGEFALCALDGRFWLLGGFLKKHNFPVRRGEACRQVLKKKMSPSEAPAGLPVLSRL